MSDKKTILLVDDVVDFTDLMKIELESWGYEVIIANDGKEGLTKALAETPDLILLDIMMPRMNGFEMYIAFKENPDYKGTPVVMISAKGDPWTRQKAKDLGVNGYICKSELHDKLKTTVETFLK